MRPTKISHFFGTFINQKNNKLHFGVILSNRIGDVMQQRRFASARRRDNQTALANSQRRHQIHDPRGVTIRDRLELDAFVRIDGRQFFKWAKPLIFRRLLAIDRQQLRQLRTTAAAPYFAVDPHAVTQSEAAHNFWRDKDVLRRLHKIPLWIAQKAEAFARDFNDALAKFRFALNWIAGFAATLSGFSGGSRSGLIERLDGNISAGIVGIRGGRIRRFFRLIAPKPITAVTPSRESAARTMMALLRRCGLSFQRRRLVFVFFVHKVEGLFAAVWGAAP